MAANEFATASGLAVEDASRWQEVAADVGVTTETLQGAINKMNLAAGAGKLDALGIGGDTVNDKLVNSLEHLKGVTNASDRAKQGMALFGKSWTALAPLVDASGDLRENLAAVSDGKVIDDEEIAKAKRLRDAVDTLNDTLDDLKLLVGEELIGPLTDFATGIGNLVDTVDGASLGITRFGGSMDILTSPLRNVTDGFSTLTDSSRSLDERARGLGQAITGAIPGPLGSWAAGMFDVGSAQDSTAALIEATNTKMKAQAEAAAAAETALEEMNTAMLAQFNAQLAYEDSVANTTEKIVDYTAKQREANASAGINTTANQAATVAQNDAAQAALALAAAALKVAEDQAAANGATLTATQQNALLRESLRTTAATLAPGSPLRVQLEGYISDLNGIPAKKTTEIVVNYTVGGGAGGGGGGSWGGGSGGGAFPRGVPVPTPVCNRPGSAHSRRRRPRTSTCQSSCRRGRRHRKSPVTSPTPS